MEKIAPEIKNFENVRTMLIDGLSKYHITSHSVLRSVIAYHFPIPLLTTMK